MGTRDAINNLATVLALCGFSLGMGLVFVVSALRRIATALEKRNSYADRQNMDMRDRFPGAPR